LNFNKKEFNSMTTGVYGGSGAAASAHAAAIANATKASGAIVRVTPQDFEMILAKTENPLVVMAESHFFGSSFKYLTSYRGLVFFTKSPEPLQLPSKAELITAKKIWIPT
jgi:hypothetical protein